MGLRSFLTLDFYKRAHDHIVEQYPYWNRTSGRDHIWVRVWCVCVYLGGGGDGNCLMCAYRTSLLMGKHVYYTNLSTLCLKTVLFMG